jgi:hypothetical protein
MLPSSNGILHRDHRSVYSGPGRNILGSDDIGVRLEPAQNALELALRLSALPGELDFIGGPQLEGSGREPVASLVEAGHMVHKGGLLCRLQEELAAGDQLHVHRSTVSMVGGQGHFLPRLKSGASVACSRRVEGFR